VSERGSTKHGPRIDGQLKHEDQPIVQGHGPSHVEEWREAEGVPDDTDSAETERAYRMRGRHVDASNPASDPEDPASTDVTDLPSADEPQDAAQPRHLRVGDVVDPRDETNKVRSADGEDSGDAPRDGGER